MHTDFSVDLEGEIQCGRAYRQFDDPSLRSEDDDGILQQLVLDLIHVVFVLLDFL